MCRLILYNECILHGKVSSYVIYCTMRNNISIIVIYMAHGVAWYCRKHCNFLYLVGYYASYLSQAIVNSAFCVGV